MTRYSVEHTGVGIGDVLVTREGPWIVSALIRLGAKLTGRPAFCNHVIIVHHRDARGTLWGLEGRPGGVGWRDLTEPLKGVLTNANNEQPKTEEQRYLIAVASESLLATPYDWMAIAEHTRVALSFWERVKVFKSLPGGLSFDAAKEFGEERPAHVVCSAYADWAYEQVGLKNPGGNAVTRMTSPGDWDKFIMERAWENGA
jgi:hypothetical protein